MNKQSGCCDVLVIIYFSAKHCFFNIREKKTNVKAKNVQKTNVLRKPYQKTNKKETSWTKIRHSQPDTFLDLPNQARTLDFDLFPFCFFFFCFSYLFFMFFVLFLLFFLFSVCSFDAIIIIVCFHVDCFALFVHSFFVGCFALSLSFFMFSFSF